MKKKLNILIYSFLTLMLAIGCLFGVSSFVGNNALALTRGSEAIYVGTSATFNVKSGTIGTTGKDAIYNDGILNITGGTINGNIKNNGTINYSAGTINGTVTLAKGKYVALNANPTGTIKITLESGAVGDKIAEIKSGVSLTLSRISVTNLPANTRLVIESNAVKIKPVLRTITFSIKESGYGTVTNSLGTAVTSITVDHGSTLTISDNKLMVGGQTYTATPSATTAQYTYAFSSWSVSNNSTITANTTITATFTRTTRSYTVTYKVSPSGYGTLTRTSQTVPYGSAVSVNNNVITVNGTPNTATVTNVTGHTTVFSSWSGVPSTNTITGATTITANFTRTANTYTLYMNYGKTNLVSGQEKNNTYTGNNATVTYTASNGNYSFVNTASSDPFATIATGVNLTGGTKYIIHATVKNSSGTVLTNGNIQIFYAINQGYSEAQSVRIYGEGAVEFTPSTTGTYCLRLDNDYGQNIIVSNLFICPASDTTNGRGSASVKYGASYTLPTPTRTGFTFAGWDVTGAQSYNSSTRVLVMGTNTVASAKWTRNACNITFNTEGYGTVNRSSQTDVYYGAALSVNGNKITINGVTTTATVTNATGYTTTFLGWYLGTTKITSSTTITSATTITAKFSREINKYTVTLSRNDASYGTLSTYSVTNVPYNTTATISGNNIVINGTTVTPTVTNATGYQTTFDGWYIGTTKITSSVTITGATTITAKFTRVAVYTVTFSSEKDVILSALPIQTKPYGNVTWGLYSYSLGTQSSFTITGETQFIIQYVITVPSSALVAVGSRGTAKIYVNGSLYKTMYVEIPTAGKTNANTTTVTVSGNATVRIVYDT